MTTPVETNAVGMGRTVDLSFEETVQRAERALQQEGFGILTRIDVKATLKEKIGVDFPAYLILGACMPSMAHQALSAEPQVGLMMPCNVVVRAVGEGRTRVEAMNAGLMARMFPEADLAGVAGPVTDALTRVVEAI